MTNTEKGFKKVPSPWKVKFLPSATKQFEKLDKSVCRMINTYIQNRLATPENPRRFGKSLTDNLKGFWRYRIGDYRLVCKIEDEQVLILVVRVDHRKDVYE